nr:hypothetical protein Iba_chr12bCG14290 [Ipomoea batatas]
MTSFLVADDFEGSHDDGGKREAPHMDSNSNDGVEYVQEHAKQSIHDMWKLVESLVKQKGTIEEKFDFLGGQVDNANQRGQVEQKLDIIHESQLILGKNQEFMRDSDDKRKMSDKGGDRSEKKRNYSGRDLTITLGRKEVPFKPYRSYKFLAENMPVWTRKWDAK